MAMSNRAALSRLLRHKQLTSPYRELNTANLKFEYCDAGSMPYVVVIPRRITPGRVPIIIVTPYALFYNPNAAYRQLSIRLANTIRDAVYRHYMRAGDCVMSIHDVAYIMKPRYIATPSSILIDYGITDIRRFNADVSDNTTRLKEIIKGDV